jgi:outer membrane protein OmpA-like peptidoglycan-associated protein
MSLKKTLLAATILALPLAAQAQPVTGFYVGAAAGLNWMQDSDMSLAANSGQVGAARNGSASFDMGYAVVLSAGYGYGNGLRAEIEANYRYSDSDRISGFGNAAAAVRTDGGVASYGVMLNAFYDFDMGPGSFFYPYVGAGVGYMNINPDGLSQTSRANAANVVQVVGNEWQFAYQAIIGAAFPISAAPGLSLTAEYRYVAALDSKVDAYVFRPTGRTRTTAEMEYANHSVMVGLRYAFGVDAAPAPVPPAPAPQVVQARTFLVFFDFDRADLTDRARQIIAEAATASRSNTTRIEVSGHADRSGTPQYNQRLSERRAQAVAAELERRGVARSAMAIQAFGETRPLVPTADGVREPQNRRVEIVLR